MLGSKLGHPPNGKKAFNTANNRSDGISSAGELKDTHIQYSVCSTLGPEIGRRIFLVGQ